MSNQGETADSVRVWRVYTGEDQETHLEPIDVPLERKGHSALSTLLAGSGVILRRTPADLMVDWHPAPRRQFIVTLAGRGEVETSDGSILPLEPGTIMLAEDVDGIGHISRAVGDEERVSLFLPLDDDTTLV